MADTFSNTAVEQGALMLFSHYKSGGDMWTGDGPRVLSSRVTFETPFRGMPVVHVSMGLIDVATAVNLRTDISAEDIDRLGFSVVFRTWGDSRIARIRADWLAIGPGHDPDVWAVD